jgi:single-strand DNA-binding protein
MAGEIEVTVIGNLAADPELRFIPSGAAVTNFTVAQTPRTFDRQSNEWKDGETVWMRCAIWRDYAENIAASLHKGDRVIVRGRLKQRTYEKDGVNHTVTELDADEVGAAMRYAEVAIRKTERTQGGQQAGYSSPQGQWGAPQQGAPPPQQQPQGQPDQWAGQQPPAAPQQGWGAPPAQQPQQQQPWGQPQPGYSEPPF